MVKLSGWIIANKSAGPEKIAINWSYSADIVPAQVKGNINICAEDSVLGKDDCLFFPESKQYLIKIVEIVYPPYFN